MVLQQVSEAEIPATRIDFGIAQPLLIAWKVPVRVTDQHWKKFSESDVSKKIQKRKKQLAERELSKKKKATNDENCVTVTNPNPPSEGQRPVVLFSGINDPEPLKRMVRHTLSATLGTRVEPWVRSANDGDANLAWLPLSRFFSSAGRLPNPRKTPHISCFQSSAELSK